MTRMFRDRETAGKLLADEVLRLGLSDPVVFALPRGGVPVALPVAQALNAPLDLLMVRKLGVPGHEELAMGAVVDGDAPDVVWNPEVLRQLDLSEAERDRAVQAKLAEIDDRRRRYLGDRPPVPVAGRDAVVVDDGIATGATVRAALRALRRRGPSSITLAVPVAPDSALEVLRADVDHVVCLASPRPFFAVGAHYANFGQTTDDEVIRAMAGHDTEKDNR